MKLKSLLKNFPVFAAAVALALAFVVITAFAANIWLALAELVVLVVIVALVFVYSDIMNVRKQKMLSHISSNLDFLSGNASQEFPMPVYVCSLDGNVIWYNNLFESSVIGGKSDFSEFKSALKDIGIESMLSSGAGVAIDCENSSFTVYSHKAKNHDEDVAVMYLVETTKYRKIADEFVKSRPAIAIITIDNMTELQQDYRESDCAAIRNGVEKLIESWVRDSKCFMTKVSDSKFYIVTEKRHVDSMIADKFDILDSVRGFTYDGKYVGVTISVGIGSGLSYSECESNAKLSIDMALGRGGDQAAVKTKDGYEFFGGISKSVENNNKVRVRIVASALSELIQGCENLFIMGHRFPDFDAMGAAFGIATIAESLGKAPHIVTDPVSSMAAALLEAAYSQGRGDLIVSSADAARAMSQGKKNLLVVVDTHIKNFTEFPELIDKANMLVVIDHHRKAVEYIDNAVIFFHDPSASSASEMVTHLVEYIPATTHLGSFTADALMAGIMLDTKNFILRTGSSTFEAAAFLKTQGSSNIRVKRMFANDMDSYNARNQIISAAKKYRNCAIAVAETENENIRMISAQAADELLNISGVDASFVIFKLGNAVCVSARSFGAVNVQVIMEYMNGGGHQTMAAVQIKDTTVEKTVEEVMRSIEHYIEINKKKEV